MREYSAGFAKSRLQFPVSRFILKYLWTVQCQRPEVMYRRSLSKLHTTTLYAATPFGWGQHMKHVICHHAVYSLWMLRGRSIVIYSDRLYITSGLYATVVSTVACVTINESTSIDRPRSSNVTHCDHYLLAYTCISCRYRSLSAYSH